VTGRLKSWPGTPARVRLDLFNSGDLDRGRSRPVEVAWVLVRSFFFMSSLPWPSALKAHLLRAFGAEVGVGFYLRPRTYVHFPWKLRLGDHVWIGEACTLLNLEPLEIGSHTALAHEVYVTTGGHDISSSNMRYANRPSTIGSSCWLATRSFVGPGVRVGDGVVVAAGGVVVSDVDPWVLVGGVPAHFISKRILRIAEETTGAGSQ
jgi:putative colanic acid biosynthesis acetyltransferase WcaF